MLLRHVFYGPENDPSGGGDPITDTDLETFDADGNPVLPAGTLPVDPDMSRKLSKSFAEGKTAGKRSAAEQYAAMMRELGIEILNDDSGKPDVRRSLTTFKSSSVNATEAVRNLHQDYERQLATERQKANTIAATLKQQQIEHRLVTALMPYDLVDSEGAKMLFLARFTVDEQDGALFVMNKDGSVVFDPKTASAISIDGAVKTFLEANQYLVKPMARDAGGGVGQQNMRGTPARPIDANKLQEAFFSETDPKKKESLRKQMMEAIQFQRSK